jgi:hypothetical protein
MEKGRCNGKSSFRVFNKHKSFYPFFKRNIWKRMGRRLKWKNTHSVPPPPRLKYFEYAVKLMRFYVKEGKAVSVCCVKPSCFSIHISTGQYPHDNSQR